MKSSCLLLLWLSLTTAMAQTNWNDTIVQLKSVNVVVYKNHFLQSGIDGITDMPMDSAILFTLSATLQQDSRFFIKNYGPSALATVNYKGTSPTQNNILWNGIKLNAPSNGQMDLNILLSSGIDEVYVVQSGNNGTIGSNIVLESNLDSKKNISNRFFVEGGSFQSIKISNATNYAAKGFLGKTAVAFQHALNDFSFSNRFLAIDKKVKMQNAAQNSYAIMQELKYNVNPYHAISAAFWMNQAMREIPPTFTQKESKQWQEDAAYRCLVSYEYSKKNLGINIKSALLTDKMQYVDPVLAIKSELKNISSQSQLNWRYTHKNKWTFQGQFFYTFEKSQSPNYSISAQRNLYGAKVQSKYRINANHELSLLLKQELINRKNAPFAFHFYYAGKAKIMRSTLNWDISIAKAYRIPSMNDMYWSIGGNPTLKPEKSYNSDINFAAQTKKVGTFSFNPFVIYAIDWIQWSPVTGSYWSASNYKKVLSRGFAIAAKNTVGFANLKKKYLSIDYAVNVTYTKITSLATNDQEPNAIGKQLIYQPRWQTNCTFALQSFGFRAAYHFDYVGKRFTSSDNTTSLSPYLLHDFSISKSFSLHKVSYTFMFAVNNLTDKTVEVIALRPLPGRSFNFKFMMEI